MPNTPDVISGSVLYSAGMNCLKCKDAIFRMVFSLIHLACCWKREAFLQYFVELLSRHRISAIQRIDKANFSNARLTPLFCGEVTIIEMLFLDVKGRRGLALQH
jgi:hypothetical protein